MVEVIVGIVISVAMVLIMKFSHARTKNELFRFLPENLLPGNRSARSLPEFRTGFVAMEYHHLFMNRTYMVLVSGRGLYGIKVSDTISAEVSDFFRQFEDLLPTFVANMTEARAIEVCHLSGNFFVPRNEVKALEFDPTQKWGMGPVPHTGKLQLQFVNGGKRELILLGATDGESLRAEIMN